MDVDDEYIEGPSEGRTRLSSSDGRWRVKTWGWGLTAALAIPLGLWALQRRWAGGRYEGPATDHCDGRRFYNQASGTERSSVEALRWMISRRQPTWPAAWDPQHDPPPGPPPPHRVDGETLRITPIGHATVLIQAAGLNLLTDPIWSRRASPVSWAGPARVRPPGLAFADLPPIDIVVLSHNHYDHLDEPTLRRLAKEHQPRIICGLGNARWLAARGIPGGEDVDWWQEVALTDALRLVVAPAQHWAGRSLSDRYRSLWISALLETPAGAVYFAGDTGLGPHFEQIRQRYGAPRVALLPIGAHRPRWFMADNHMSPADAVKAHEILGAQRSLALHHGVFQLADEGPEDAVEELASAVAVAALDANEVCALSEGVAIELKGPLPSPLPSPLPGGVSP